MGHTHCMCGVRVGRATLNQAYLVIARPHSLIQYISSVVSPFNFMLVCPRLTELKLPTSPSSRFSAAVQNHPPPHLIGNNPRRSVFCCFGGFLKLIEIQHAKQSCFEIIVFGTYVIEATINRQTWRCILFSGQGRHTNTGIVQ
jgi:hypothetical protein